MTTSVEGETQQPEKCCQRCKSKKALGEFNKNRSARDGLQDRCRECQRIVQREYYERKGQEFEAKHGAAS